MSLTDLADALDPRVHPDDERVSQASLIKLRTLISGPDRSLVFFVGAGASSAGSTGMPTTPQLLRALLSRALKHSGAVYPEKYVDLKRMLFASLNNPPGFEITLNDLLQICPNALKSFFKGFAVLERRCTPNSAHQFLAYWLVTGGTVVTTNYDRLIERALAVNAYQALLRYTESEGPGSFKMWRDDLERGGALFKVHGSLTAPASCLGALEHVGTRLEGSRAELLKTIVQDRPVCFVGWRGADPDIPPLLAEMSATREKGTPSYWIHYEGRNPSFVRLMDCIDKLPESIRYLGQENPILTDANRLFRALLKESGHRPKTATKPYLARPRLAGGFRSCSRSGMARFVGISLRRVGKFEEAFRVLDAALELAETDEERSAAIQEIALAHWSRDEAADKGKARQLVKEAMAGSGVTPDFESQLSADFGSVSMTVLALKTRPWLVFTLPGLFRKYEKDINAFRERPADLRPVALHTSLLQLYRGRLRINLLGWLRVFGRRAHQWLLDPFEIARQRIDEAGDIHPHARVDVLSYRAVALALCDRCRAAWEDVAEIDRLCDVLSDERRKKHWLEDQRREIERKCPRASLSQNDY